MTYHRAQAEKSRHAILQAAEIAFLREGYAGASIDLILKEAGVSRATLFKHFSNKENLFDQVCQQIYARKVPEIHMTEDYFSGLLDYLYAFTEAVLAPESLNVHRLAIQEVDRFPALSSSHYSAGIEKILVNVKNYLQAGQKKGLVRNEQCAILTEQLLVSSFGYRQYRGLLRVPAAERPIAEYVELAIEGALTPKGIKAFQRTLSSYSPQGASGKTREFAHITAPASG